MFNLLVALGNANLAKSGRAVACNYRAGLFIRGFNLKNECTGACRGGPAASRSQPRTPWRGAALGENIASPTPSGHVKYALGSLFK